MTAVRTWRLAGIDLVLDRPRIMGVVNVTPDSFSDGGRYLRADAAIEHGLQLIDDGADLIDVGGESTRPGAEPVPATEELHRVLPVVAGLTAAGVVVSIDTSKAAVAAGAVEAGAVVINDVTALGDPAMPEVAGASGAGLVLMHMQGTPATMQARPFYDDVVGEVSGFLVERAVRAERSGVDSRSIALDPGIGFGKTVDHNLALLRDLGVLAGLGYPLLVGTSRKSFLAKVAGRPDGDDQDVLSAVSAALAFERGADLVRVHNVAACRAAARLALAIVRGKGE